MKKNDDTMKKIKGNEGSAEKAADALSGILFIQIDAERLKALGIDGWEAGSSLPVQTQGQILRFDPSMISIESIVAGDSAGIGLAARASIGCPVQKACQSPQTRFAGPALRRGGG